MNRDGSLVFPGKAFWSEFVGTGLLLLIGLSLVTLMFGVGSPLGEVIPNLKLRQAITGFLFGGTGALISISAVAKASGAHFNPVVTLAFWLFGKLDYRTALLYILAQLMGAVTGCLPLLLWGDLGRSISFGATMPGEGYSPQDAVIGEIATTFVMVSLLIVFLGFRQMRHYTPALFPLLYAIMVPLEADISGTSTNPARSFGPAVISGHWQAGWVYWIGPFAGALLACIACSMFAKRITEAKIYHFDSAEDKLFRKKKRV